MSKAKTFQTDNLLSAFQHETEILLKVTPSIMIIFEMGGGILIANAAAASFLGRTITSILGKNIYELFKFENAYLQTYAMQLAQSLKDVSFENTSKGRIFSCVLSPMLSEGNIIRVVLSAQDITERRRTEEQLRTLTQELDSKVRERTEELQKANQQLRGLSQQLVDLQEDQIKYLAREIHDSVGQNLTAININLTLLQKTLPENYPDAIKSRLVDTSQIVEETVVRMRNIMAEFLPPMLESYGLSTALVWYGQQFTTRMNIPVLVNDHSLGVFRLPPQTEIGFFRIVQEALNNIAKYAQATQVNIDLKGDGDHVLMTIADNGMGFDAKVVFAEQSTHWGFAIMRERARVLDASFNIESAPGKGTKVIVRIAR